MNPIQTMTLYGGFKKQLAIVLATMTIIVALPTLAVFSLGGDAVSFLAGTPSAEAAASQGFYMGEDVPGDTYAWGNCTYWAYAMRYWAKDPVPTTWGNANTWDDRAKADGYVVDHIPSEGAVYQTDAGSLGHVAYVAQVNTKTGEWMISEMNFAHINVVSTRTFTASAAQYYTFIHDKKVVTP